MLSNLSEARRQIQERQQWQSDNLRQEAKYVCLFKKNMFKCTLQIYFSLKAHCGWEYL